MSRATLKLDQLGLQSEDLRRTSSESSGGLSAACAQSFDPIHTTKKTDWECQWRVIALSGGLVCAMLAATVSRSLHGTCSRATGLYAQVDN